jgi:protoporphyrin/coproporphyrin ferrochelatase
MIADSSPRQADLSMKKDKSLGVILFQLGGPDSLAAIEPFLYNLFCDPDIIDFPLARIARKPLARLISSNRARRVQSHYAEIGGRSPILEFTAAQARALEKELNKSLSSKVFIAMRYWHPMTEETLRAVEKASLDELVLLPLYPQYSKTTTGSSLNEWNRQVADSPVRNLTVRVVKEFYTDEVYLDAVVEKMQGSLEKFSQGEPVHLVFSAHSVPVSVITSGDPYKDQIEATVELVMRRGVWSHPYSICYQSKVGASKWLQPSLHETLHQLAGKGTKNLLVIPIAFVSDHVETLNEIDLEARKEAEDLGIQHFEMMPGLNDSPKFVQALAGLVLEAVGAKSPKQMSVTCA